MWIGAPGVDASLQQPIASPSASVRHRAQRVRRDAEAQVRVARERGAQALEQPGEAVEVVHEAALPGSGGRAAEAAAHVQHRQQGQADAGSRAPPRIARDISAGSA